MLETNFATAAMGGFVGYLVYFLKPLLALSPLGALMRDVRTSAKILSDLAIGVTYPDATATYFSDDKATASSKFSLSVRGLGQVMGELWQYSSEWTGVTQEELRTANLL